ncbi:MAG: DHH family phosphoesterase [Candidatus Diapherotrites archaeon]|nr:DHH family phosphoesterase [Candidatus Diapherotrites archaeon]
MLPNLSSFKKNNILLLAHAGADVDAMAASAALFFALKKNNSVTIGVPEHISLNAKTFSENMRIPYEINPEIDTFDTIFIIDFNSKDMLAGLAGQVQQFKEKIFVIDHHSKSKEQIAKKSNVLIDDSRIAASEMVFELLKKNRVKISREIASCIAAGIIEDSAHFLTADKSTFKIMAECMEKSGKTYAELFLLFKPKREKSKRIALLKAAERIQIFEAGEFIVALSEVGAFEAEAAASLVRMGADIAFVGNIEKGEARISGRAGKYVLQKTGISLAEHVMQKLGIFFPGNGGGHDAAAAFNGRAENIQNPLQKCAELTIDWLKTIDPEIKLKKH